MKIYDHVYLSPHYDDAALSCGGAIHQQRRAGQAVLVVTICSAPPAPGEVFSPFAREIHGAMGNPDNLVAMRRDEDRAAIDRLGAEVVWLDFQDAVYRGRTGEDGWYIRASPRSSDRFIQTKARCLRLSRLPSARRCPSDRRQRSMPH